MSRLRLAALALVIAASPALAVFPPPVKDDAKFFKAGTIEAANKKIREIYEKYKRDVVVETLPSLTADQVKEMEDDKDRFFARLALNRSKALGLNGVYILLVKKPARLQIHVDPETAKKAFTNADRNKVRDRIVARFKEDDFDGGLQAAFDAVEAALKANLK